MPQWLGGHRGFEPVLTFSDPGLPMNDWNALRSSSWGNGSERRSVMTPPTSVEIFTDFV
jgi:hypothetical protein